MKVIDKTYKILVVSTNEVQRFTTSLTEKEFYKNLDAVYGAGNYTTLDVE